MRSGTDTNPYKFAECNSGTPENDTSRATCLSVVQGIPAYLVPVLVLHLTVAPLIAPTDGTSHGAPPIPGYLVAIQTILVYGLPLPFLWPDSSDADD